MLNPFSKEYKEAVKKLGRDYKTIYNESAKAYKEGLKTYDEDKRKSDEEAKRKLEEEKAGWPKTGIVGDCLQIVDKYGKLFTCPVDQAKLFSISDNQITITVKGHFLDKIFHFDEKDKEAYERIADALPSDIWYSQHSALRIK